MMLGRRCAAITVALGLAATPSGAAGSGAAVCVATGCERDGAAGSPVATTTAAVAGSTLQVSAGGWLGPDLRPLPLTEDEILDVLRTGEILERVPINIGINGIDRLLLEKDGVRLHAGFRSVDVRERGRRVGDENYMLFRDSYLFECAAYELARALGIVNVPPTTQRRIRGVAGSVQLWIEDLFEDPNAARSPDYRGWALQISTMMFFDALIYNVDRNPGNVQIDHQYRLWMIDHTRAFQYKPQPFQLERVVNVRRDIWDRLLSLRREDFESLFSGLLEPAQVAYFMDRRARLIDYIQALIEEHGDAVLLEPRRSPVPATSVARRPPIRRLRP